MAKDGVSNSTGYQMPLFEFDEENLEKLKHNAANDSVGESEFGKYIVYVDESGDHSLQSIDQSYPIFALAFSIFHKRHYSETIVPVIEKFKFNHFGHDQVILHEHEILKRVGVFNFSGNRSRQQQFMSDLTRIMAFGYFILIATVIEKQAIKKHDVDSNAYHLALAHCMETLYELLMEKDEHHKKCTWLLSVVEKRRCRVGTRISPNLRRQ